MSASSDSAIRVAEPYEERVVCEHADRCAGCPVIGLPYPEQLALKRGRVVQSVARYPALELAYTEPVAPAQPLIGYRTRAKLIAAPGGRIGLYAKGGGHQVVDIPRCRVLAPVLMRVASVLRARIAASETQGGPLAPYDGPDGRGCLRAVDLREVRDGDVARALVTFVVQRESVRSLDGLRGAARQLMLAAPDVIGVAVNFHDGDGPQILGAETSLLAGVSSAPDRLGASMHLATYGSFVQAHRGQASRVHSVLVDALGLARGRQPERKPRVLDLYGGSGAMALGLASAGASVRLVESFEPAVQQARTAAERLCVDVEAQCADAATALRALAERKEHFDAAVVNPPRRGTSPMAREWLARLQPGVIAYVSCDPETLARDLDHFARLGYAATTLRPVDMIPLTDEVETVAILRPSGVPLPPVVYDNGEVLIVDKGPHEPTTPQGEYASSLLARVRRIPGAERAVPVQRLDVGTSGLVTFARAPEYVAKWDRALGSPSTRKIYVAAVRGVIPGKGTITRELKEDGKPHAARTRYRRLAVAAGHSIVRVVPEQGRTHQIRRHLASIGYPVLGDARYGHEPTNRYFEEKNALDRAFLHCVRLEFEPPEGGGRRCIEAPLPGDLRAVLERTSGPGTLRFLDHKNALGTTATSNLPPGPDEILHDRGSALDVNANSPSLYPELTTDDDDRQSGEY
jgi:23S rRNA (uracil1939-C5)-methyltransferase